jgi:hypothetical protein
MSYGVINIKYGGAESTRFVEKEEFYTPQSVPSGAQVDHYINLEYYSNLKEDLNSTSHSLQISRDAYSNAFKCLQNMRVENDKLKSTINDLRNQLDRANHVIDYMLERVD